MHSFYALLICNNLEGDTTINPRIFNDILGRGTVTNAWFICDNLEGDTTINPRIFNGNLGGGTVTNAWFIW